MSVHFAKCLYDFDGGRTDNLTFKEGDILTVLKQDAGGWWTGSTLDGRIGIFPRNYVEVNEVRDSYDVAVAEFDFKSDKDGDLSFADGDEIIVLRHLSPEWWKGRTDDKREGIFPASYVRLTGEVDYATADEEAAKWTEIIRRAKETAGDLAKRRKAAEDELEGERVKVEEANKRVAEARANSDLANKKERDAKREEQLEKVKKAEIVLQKQRDEAEKKHEEARQKLVNMRLEEDASQSTIKAAEEKKEKAKKAKENDDRFADVQEVGKRPTREVKKTANKFANLGGGDKCPICNTSAGVAERCKGPGDVWYHTKCFRCSTCDKQLVSGQFSENSGHPYCAVCYGRGFGPKGFGFGGSVTSEDGGGIGKDRKNASGVVEEKSIFDVVGKKN